MNNKFGTANQSDEMQADNTDQIYGFETRPNFETAVTTPHFGLSNQPQYHIDERVPRLDERVPRLDERAPRLDERVPRPRDCLDNLPEKEQVLFYQYGFGPQKVPSHRLIHKAIEAQALIQPESLAVCDDGQCMSYFELDQYASRLAVLLIEKGVKPGDCVPLFVERSVAMVVGILAILKTGAAYAPQHVGVAPIKQLRFVAESSKSPLILTLDKFRSDLESQLGLICLSLDTFITDNNNSVHRQQLTSPAVEIETKSRCLVLFTSGTTGTPNGVQVTHQNLCNILLTNPGNLGIKSGSIVAQILSIAFDMAAWEILGCLGNGGTLLIRGSDIAKTAAKANVLIATPSILSEIDPALCKYVTTVAVAGEPCPRNLADTWSRCSRFYNSCGPTETTIVNTMQEHDASSNILSIGKPTPNNSVYILNEEGTPCQIGGTGVMWAGGDCVTAGYLNNPQLTADRYRRDPFLGGENMMFNTRDLGRWTESGELEHLGRTDDQVKIRGFRVELDSVSAILEAIDGCRRAATLKLDSRSLIAFVSPTDIDTELARRRVADALPYYCTPKHVVALPELPMTSRGKIDKKALAEAARDVTERDRLTESSPTQKQPIHSEKQNAPQGQSLKNDNSKVQPVATAEPIAKHPYMDIALPPQNTTLAARLTHHRFYHYWRLAATVVLVNILFLVYGATAGHWWSSTGIKLQVLMNLVVANISMAILIRQQYVINLLFYVATNTPHWAPLRFRQLMGKVYHFGGIHIGGAICGTAWLIITLGSMVAQSGYRLPGVELSSVTVLLLVALINSLGALILSALPVLRQHFHNGFEKMHRFGGWLSLALFWALALSFTHDSHPNDSLPQALTHSPAFWALVLVSFSIALPWLRLKRVPIDIERPSDHVAIVNFDYGVTPFAGSSTAVSRSPLTEWHSFANVPAPGKSGFRLTISRAGDWTGRLIDDLPSHLWVKGIPTAGVGNVDQLFRKVVWVATGSGIGPTLPHLLSREVPAHLIWSTRNARTTYGDKIVDEILEVEPDALIWDTDRLGRPDLVHLAFAAVQTFDAEAVIVIANEKLTRMVVHGMESRGIPAYGAIWDS